MVALAPMAGVWSPLDPMHLLGDIRYLLRGYRGCPVLSAGLWCSVFARRCPMDVWVAASRLFAQQLVSPS
eukprot:2195346-Rhodomonas_salina.1